tara:strand:- start:2652 stop:3176 length:525 start_codon:yes stop_codon:yes gene_type:complete
MKKKIDIKLIQKKDLSLKILKEWIYWLNDKEVTKFSNQRFKKHTVSSQKNYLFEKLKKKNNLLFKIEYQGVFVGVIEIGSIDFDNENCELMYFLGNKKLWSKGIGTKCINLAIKYIKNNMRLKKVYAGCNNRNKASIKILKKNQFKIEGKIRNFLTISKQKKKRDDKVILGLNL